MDSLTKVSLIVGIVVGLIIIGGTLAGIWKSVGGVVKEGGTPFSLTVQPEFIPEGDYRSTSTYNNDGGVPLKFNLILNNKDLTYLELSNVIVDRENKNSLTKFADSLQWKRYDGRYYGEQPKVLSTSSNLQSFDARLYGCQNCFMGEESPYVITFNFIYSISNGTKQSYPYRIKIPIK